MRGWLAHMSVKADLLFITQTFVAAGVEVMSLTAAYSLCVSVCLSLDPLSIYLHVRISVNCVQHTVGIIRVYV